MCASAILPRNRAPSIAPRTTPTEVNGLTVQRYQDASLQGHQDDLRPRHGPRLRSSGLNESLQQETIDAIGGLQSTTK